MIHINYIYNRSKKSTARRPSDLSFSCMERDVRKLFPLGDRPLFYFYVDENRSRILILDDEEFKDIARLALAQLSPFKIYLNLREKLIQETTDADFLQRLFVRECLRHQMGQFSKRRLIADLHSIRDSMMRAQMKPALIKKIIKGISTEVQTLAVEDTFGDMKPTELERQETGRGDWAGPEVAPSFSSILDHQTAQSFFSAGDLVVFNEGSSRKCRKSDLCQQPDPPESELGRESKEDKAVCSKCRCDVREHIRFECERCPKLLLCEGCNAQCGHKHPMKPVFIVNDSRQKITALSRMFRRLKQARAEFFFAVMKAVISKHLPHR